MVATLFLGGTIVYHFRSAGQRPVIPYLYFLVGISYFQTLVSGFTLPKVRRLRLFAQLQVIWDLLFTLFLVYLTGGIDSPFAFLLIIGILVASVLLSRKDIFLVASASAILYGSLLDLQYYGYLPQLDQLSLAVQVDANDCFYAVFVNVLAIFLTAILGSLLADRLRRSEQALRQREIDFEELEHLNRSILANITSGLMIVNPKGRIRSFNSGAEKISGYSLTEVYDRDVREIFPGLSVYNDGLRVVRRGEGVFADAQGRIRVLGYASSMAKDPQEKDVGLLVTFQDLTKLKEMEEQLKRADRLAAVGRLASGMAHEIRNPLASISGSVQLLMETPAISKDDRCLMGIVVREADRLSELLTDFLQYARPAPLVLEIIDVSGLFDELADLVQADARFAGIKIRREYQKDVSMRLDRKQIRQALWNLVINAAEATGNKGEIWLGVELQGSGLFVEDAGLGIPDDIRGRIFDPFFTTKDRGTGLGLATVHTIIEAHGGSVEVATGRKNGTRFTLWLPGQYF